MRNIFFCALPVTLFTSGAAFAQARELGFGLASRTLINTLGLFGLIFIVICVAVIGYSWMIRQIEHSVRQEILGGVSLETEHVIAVFCGIAKADGKVPIKELRAIQKLTQRYTHQEVQLDLIMRILKTTSPRFHPTHFLALRKMIRGRDIKAKFLHFMMEMMAADGEMHDLEQIYINGLCDYLGIGQELFNSVLMDFTDGKQL